MACYFGKHDRLAVGAVILLKIPKMATLLELLLGLYNTESASGVDDGRGPRAEEGAVVAGELHSSTITVPEG
jgi:hypothetical protein